jgi:hypothetical protein
MTTRLIATIFSFPTIRKTAPSSAESKPGIFSKRTVNECNWKTADSTFDPIKMTFIYAVDTSTTKAVTATWASSSPSKKVPLRLNFL